MQITIVDYGMGNLGSIANMVHRLGHVAVIASDAESIQHAEKIILPGVGSFDRGMKHLHENGLVDVLNSKVMIEKIPVLGVCLGLQLMACKSEEGNLKGLAWLNTNVVKFDDNKTDEKIRIPHMGWNVVRVCTNNPLIQNDGTQRFYFVHSYHLDTLPESQCISVTHYGYDFISAVAFKNIFGVQFHPEKSHRYGLQLLKNFIEKI